MNLQFKLKILIKFIVIFLFILPRASYGGQWENLYLADTVGSRLFTTNDPAEATIITARVVSPDFVILNTSCRSAPRGFTYLGIGQEGEIEGPSFINNNSAISFQVDKNAKCAASKPEFLQSAYLVAIPNRCLREMAAGTRLILRYGPENFQRKIFSLKGAMKALNAVDCNP